VGDGLSWHSSETKASDVALAVSTKTPTSRTQFHYNPELFLDNEWRMVAYNILVVALAHCLNFFLQTKLSTFLIHLQVMNVIPYWLTGTYKLNLQALVFKVISLFMIYIYIYIYIYKLLSFQLWMCCLTKSNLYYSALVIKTANNQLTSNFYYSKLSNSSQDSHRSPASNASKKRIKLLSTSMQRCSAS